MKFSIAKWRSGGRCGPQKAQQRAILQSNPWRRPQSAQRSTPAATGKTCLTTLLATSWKTSSIGMVNGYHVNMLQRLSKNTSAQSQVVVNFTTTQSQGTMSIQRVQLYLADRLVGTFNMGTR